MRLAEVKAGNYYGEWGFETFEEYVEQVLGIKKRKAQYLVRIVTLAKQLSIPRTQYEDVQITKLREIFTLKPFGEDHKPLLSETTGEPIGNHIKELVSKAPDMKLSAIVAEVSRIKGETGEQEMVFLSLKVTKTCRDNVILPARELARQKLGSAAKDAEGDAQEYSDSACEECIHAEFLVDPNNAEQPIKVEDAPDQYEDDSLGEDGEPDTPTLQIDADDDTSEPLGEIKI